MGVFSKKSKSASAPSDNPYAQAASAKDAYTNNPHANTGPPSMASHSSKGSGLPSGPRAGLPSGPAPRPGPAAPQIGFSPQQAPPSYPSAVSGYGSDQLGSGGGYGANRYQNQNDQTFRQNQNAPMASQPFRPGGYGGLGGAGVRPQPYGAPPGGLNRTDSASTEVHRNDLFGGAKDRHRPQPGSGYDPTAKPVTGYGQSGASSAGGYAGYGEDRELTEEDKEQALYLDTLAQKKQVKQESNAAVGRILNMTDDILDVQNDTNFRLAAQTESFANADKNMDIAENYNTSGYDKARELQKANSSMFAVHVGNPFTAKKRAQARDEAVMERHRAEKSQREETRRNRFQGYRDHDNQYKEMRDYQNFSEQSVYKVREKGAENPFAYNDDSEEDALEENIDQGLAEVSKRVAVMKLSAEQTGKTLDQHNITIDRIANKTDRVDDGVRRNRNELDKVR